MKITIILSAKFPTDKAYGVTTKETIKALSQDGHDVQVLSRNEISKQLLAGGAILRYFAIFWDYLIGLRYVSLVIFPLWQIFFGLKAKNLIDRETALVWAREPLIACLMSFLTSKVIVLEIHHSPKKLGKTLFNILRNRTNVVMAPIKGSIRDELGLEVLKTPIATMAVNESFLQIGKFRNSGRKIELKIVIVGKISNRHQRESYEQLLNQLESLPYGQVPIKVTFLGFDSYFNSRFADIQEDGLSIESKGHIVHEELPQILSEFDIGLIPYLDNSYFKDTFPIKVVEYAAAKLLIVASDTQSHREILEKRAFYYDLLQVESLKNLLMMIRFGELDTEKAIEEGYIWAQSKTYSKRVDMILERVASLTNFQ